MQTCVLACGWYCLQFSVFLAILMQRVLEMCKRRVVLFDNKTKDAAKQAEQVQQLLSLINLVMEENGGQPYSDEFFMELKVNMNLNSWKHFFFSHYIIQWFVNIMIIWQQGALKLHNQKAEVESLTGYSNQEMSQFTEQIYRSYDEQLKRITEMVNSKILPWSFAILKIKCYFAFN